eukprot:gene3328-3815_t
MADRKLNFSKQHLLTQCNLSNIVSDWLKEDTPSFDYGGYVVGERAEKAVLLCKSAGVLSGLPFFDAIFKHLDCKIEWLYEEGSQLQPVCPVAYVHGKAKNILLGERIALNVLTRASGISTKCSQLNATKTNMKWSGELAGTRKTTPGFRLVEKYALLVGRASTHRYDLSSMVMLKDNHIWSVGNVGDAVKKARETCGFALKIEVECRTMADAKDAAKAGAEVIMLDNFNPVALHNVAADLKSLFPSIIIEASGGITPETIHEYMGPNIDVISMGSLTQGYAVVDFSLKIMKEGKDPTNPTVMVE